MSMVDFQVEEKSYLCNWHCQHEDVKFWTSYQKNIKNITKPNHLAWKILSKVMAICCKI
jgi:hypothetical protein